MVGPRTKRLSSRLANPKYSNPQPPEEEDESRSNEGRPQQGSSQATLRGPKKKVTAKKKNKKLPSPPLPLNELDVPEDGYWDESGQWVDGPRPGSAASSRGGQNALHLDPDPLPVLSPVKPGVEEPSSSVGPDTPHHLAGPRSSSHPGSSTMRRKPAGQEALFLPPSSPTPSTSTQGHMPLLDYLQSSSPSRSQRPFKRQSGRPPVDDHSEGEPSDNDEDLDPPPRRRVRLSPSFSATSQARSSGSQRVVLGDLPLEDYPDNPPSSRHKTYSRRIKRIHRRPRGEPAFTPVPRGQLPSFEELMDRQVTQERLRSYPSQQLSYFPSSHPTQVPGTYDDEDDDEDEDDEWSAVLPRRGDSARRVWRDKEDENEDLLLHAHGMSPSWYRRTDRPDLPFTRAFPASQYHLPVRPNYQPGGRLEFNDKPYRPPYPIFEDEEYGQIHYTQTTNYFTSRGTATNHKKVSGATTRRSRHPTGKVQANIDSIKPIRRVPREDFLEELRLRHGEVEDYTYPVDGRLQRYTRRAPNASRTHERRGGGVRFGVDPPGEPSEPVSEFTASNQAPTRTARLCPLPHTRVGPASNAAPLYSPLKFSRGDIDAGSVNPRSAPESPSRLPTTSASSRPRDHPQPQSAPRSSNLTSRQEGGRGRSSIDMPPLRIPSEDLDILREWQDMGPGEEPPAHEEEDFGDMGDAEGDLNVDDVEDFVPPHDMPLPSVTPEGLSDQDLQLETIFNLQGYLNDSASRPSRSSREPLADLTPKPPSGGLSGLGMTDLLLQLATKTVEQDAENLTSLPSARKRKLDERKQRLAEKHNSGSSRPSAPARIQDDVIVPATLQPLQVLRPAVTERPVVIAPSSSALRPSMALPSPTETQVSHPDNRYQPQQIPRHGPAAPTNVTQPSPVFDVQPPPSQNRPLRSRFAREPQPQEKYVPLLPSRRSNETNRPPPSAASSASTQHATQPAPNAQRARSRTAAPLSAPFKQPTNTNVPPPPPMTTAQRMKARLAASFPSYDELLPKPPPPPPPPALGARARSKTEFRTRTVTESSTTYRTFQRPTGAQ